MLGSESVEAVADPGDGDDRGDGGAADGGGADGDDGTAVGETGPDDEGGGVARGGAAPLLEICGSGPPSSCFT